MLYEVVGISKQAVHKYAKRQDIFDQKVERLLVEADELREEHPGCGVEKMYYTLKPDFMGRDRFIECMMSLGYRVKRKKNYKKTTRAGAYFYPNLIQGLEVNAPSQVWQSDITYIKAGDRHYYAVFIIDVYTKKIVGYKVSDNMRGEANIEAFKMALKENDPPKYHHSDRGAQYIYKGYEELLKENGCEISMGKIAQDNAYAERINRTIKEEYLDYWKPKTFRSLKKDVDRAVKNYNTKRPHLYIGRLAPNTFEKQWKFLSMDKRPKLTIFNKDDY